MRDAARDAPSAQNPEGRGSRCTSRVCPACIPASPWPCRPRIPSSCASRTRQQSQADQWSSRAIGRQSEGSHLSRLYSTPFQSIHVKDGRLNSSSIESTCDGIPWKASGRPWKAMEGHGRFGLPSRAPASRTPARGRARTYAAGGATEGAGSAAEGPKKGGRGLAAGGRGRCGMSRAREAAEARLGGLGRARSHVAVAVLEGTSRAKELCKLALLVACGQHGSSKAA